MEKIKKKKIENAGKKINDNMKELKKLKIKTVNSNKTTINKKVLKLKKINK